MSFFITKNSFLSGCLMVATGLGAADYGSLAEEKDPPADQRRRNGAALVSGLSLVPMGGADKPEFDENDDTDSEPTASDSSGDDGQIEDPLELAITIEYYSKIRSFVRDASCCRLGAAGVAAVMCGTCYLCCCCDEQIKNRGFTPTWQALLAGLKERRGCCFKQQEME